MLQPARAAVGRGSRGSRGAPAPLRGQAEQRGELRACPTLPGQAGPASPPPGPPARRADDEGGTLGWPEGPGQSAPWRTALAPQWGWVACTEGRSRQRQRSPCSFPAGPEQSRARVGAEAGPWGETHRGGPGCEEPERILFWQRQPRMLM